MTTLHTQSPPALHAPVSPRLHFVHVPTPGDHYSPATGSAVMALIHEITLQHAKVRGRTNIVVGNNTRHDYTDGECIEVRYVASLGKHRKLLDSVLARVNLPRYFERSLYRPASDPILPEFEGTIFLHNCPGAVPLFKKYHPRALVCLYAVNALFRTYSTSEVRRTVAVADRVICCSQYIANDLISRLGKPHHKIRVVHNGVNTDRFAPRPDRIKPTIPIILFVGRAIPEKGPDLLLRAAHKIADGRRQFKLRIVGSSGFGASHTLTPYEQELRRLAAPIADHVEFQPSVDRVQLLSEYQSASISCIPSNWDDPLPLTLLESMACALPTIGSRRGGIPEGGGEDVLYFDPPDIDQLAEHLAFFVDNPDARVQWGERAAIASKGSRGRTNIKPFYAPFYNATHQHHSASI